MHQDFSCRVIAVIPPINVTYVRPWAAAVGAPGGNAGGCREFSVCPWCEYATEATVATVWSWGVWPPEYFSSQPVTASSLPDEAIW